MPGEHSGSMVGQLTGAKAKKATSTSSNPLFGGGAAGGVPLGIANPQYTGPVNQVGADMSQFPQYNNYTFHNGIGTGPTPNTDPVGSYSYGNTSVNDLLSQINSLYSGAAPNFTGEANKQSSQIFAPVLADLTSQGNLATKRSGQNDAQLKAMYAALQGSIGADGQTMQKQNTANAASIKALGAQGQKSIASNYSNAENQAAGIMQKLGIEAAAPATLPRSADSQALMQNLMQMNTQGAANLSSQLGQNAQNFNTSQKNIAGFEGTENRLNNQKALEGTMANLATERAQVGSQQAQQAIGFTQNMQNQYLNSVNQKASALTSMYSQQQQMAMQQQNMQMEMMKMKQSMLPSAYQQWQMSPTTDKLASYAGQLFGTDGSTASKALTFIESMGGNQSASPLAFADSVAKAALANPDPELRTLNPNQLRALAMQAYSQMGVNPNPINYINSATG